MLRSSKGIKQLNKRSFYSEQMDADLVVAGGGMAGTCCAITAARQGLKVVLIQDRPVLGGNASSEVRLWILGATSHMGNNNRWAREGGVIDEILVENIYRNPDGNPVIFDTILLEKVTSEENITLLLNTAVFEVDKKDDEHIEGLRAFCSQNSTMYQLNADLFCDATGDGTVGFLSGASFRMGAESRDEFNEKFAPDEAYGQLLGHSIYFNSKDVGRPVEYVPPAYALPMDKVEHIGRFRTFNLDDQGCNFWWIEYGGRLDTVHKTETIKWELWKVIYGVWNYFKNSGKFPGAKTKTLEWVGMIPGKRESRRFEGDYMMIQQDLVEQRKHDDAVSFGGWALDLHPADGIYSSQPGCDQYHAKGVYQIPYRSMYSHNIKNLFLAGRIISCTHVAFSSTRVMATCAHNAQAVAVAAAMCKERSLCPAELVSKQLIGELQNRLLGTGQYIPGFRLKDENDLVRNAQISASSQLHLKKLSNDGTFHTLDYSHAVLLPVSSGAVPGISFRVKTKTDTELQVQLRKSRKVGNFTPEDILENQIIPVNASSVQEIRVDFDVTIDEPQYVFYCILSNEHASIQMSDQRITGILTATTKYNTAVARSNVQNPETDIGMESFELWRPRRRPKNKNLAINIYPGLDVFRPENVANGICRPVTGPNAWVADFNDSNPTLFLKWNEKQHIKRMELSFDTDFDHPMESVNMQHPEQIMPFCVQNYRILDENGQIQREIKQNHQTRNTIIFDAPVETKILQIELEHPSKQVPASLFEVRCYSE